MKTLDMKTLAIALLIANIPSLTLFIISGILAYNGLNGWGWMLFAGILISKTTSNKEGEEG